MIGRSHAAEALALPVPGREPAIKMPIAATMQWPLRVGLSHRAGWLTHINSRASPRTRSLYIISAFLRDACNKQSDTRHPTSSVPLYISNAPPLLQVGYPLMPQAYSHPSALIKPLYNPIPFPDQATASPNPSSKPAKSNPDKQPSL